MEVMKKLIFMGIDLVRLKALFFDVLLDFIWWSWLTLPSNLALFLPFHEKRRPDTWRHNECLVVNLADNLVVSLAKRTCVIHAMHRIPRANLLKALLTQLSDFEMEVWALSLVVKYYLSRDSLVSFLFNGGKRWQILNLISRYWSASNTLKRDVSKLSKFKISKSRFNRSPNDPIRIW